jgi:phage shock protein PspC (stress-responsive transcriptional regulator)
MKKLYRSRTDRKLWGVCGGLGKYFNIDPVIFRIAFVVTIFFGMIGVIAYLIMLIVVPLEPEEKQLNSPEIK